MNMGMFMPNRREMTCLSMALMAHALLFMMKGLPFTFLDKDKPELGEVLVEVGFSSELPDLDATAPAVKKANKKGFFARINKFLKRKQIKKETIKQRSKDTNLRCGLYA